MHEVDRRYKRNDTEHTAGRMKLEYVQCDQCRNFTPPNICTWWSEHKGSMHYISFPHNESTVCIYFNTMTPQHRKALHLYFRDYAEGLNEAGYDVKTFLEESKYSMSVPFTMHFFKDSIWRPVQKAITKSDEYPEGKESTEDLTSTELKQIEEIVTQKMSELTGVYVEWPSEERLKHESK